MGTFFGGAFRLSPHLIRILCNLDSPFSPLPLPVQLAATALCTVSPPNRQPQRQEGGTQLNCRSVAHPEKPRLVAVGHLAPQLYIG